MVTLSKDNLKLVYDITASDWGEETIKRDEFREIADRLHYDADNDDPDFGRYCCKYGKKFFWMTYPSEEELVSTLLHFKLVRGTL